MITLRFPRTYKKMKLSAVSVAVAMFILFPNACNLQAHEIRSSHNIGHDILVSFKYKKPDKVYDPNVLFKSLRETVIALGGEPHHARVLFHAGREFEIDPFFIASVTFVESNFRPRIQSNRNAKGLMQLRPVVLEVLGVTNPWDPYQNIMAGTAYLRHCFERYSMHENSTYLALAAYNIGPGQPRKLENSEAASRFVKKVLTVYNKLSSDPVGCTRNSLNAEMMANRFAGVQ